MFMDVLTSRCLPSRELFLFAVTTPSGLSETISLSSVTEVFVFKEGRSPDPLQARN